MSVRYLITGARSGAEWPVSTACLEGAGRLTQAGLGPQLAAVCLDEGAELGEERALDRSNALAALDQLIPAARRIPKGFQVRTECFFGDPENKELQARMKELYGEEDLVARGASGLRVDGVHYHIGCVDDYWQIQPMLEPPAPEGKEIPVGMRGEPRREPAEIRTENYGVVRVETQRGRSDIETLLARIRRFLSSSPDASFRVIVG